ncbi:cyclase [Streptoalloteichus tenebrarius]|uniref:Cyclase n=1 Tax=Streptoalloteichus tenebrarius (strain ATCC 17920 / DSM 40477 / JCM 4838 / CBS 697.72 / NBRC 16177 / NCIMB 11028 / NRRL B-12390 / A12253. 1 / ISP 5477) TaxID=1933 RepID=A0ABT1I4F0_STRSD|nr:MBL fold metallo-hydrolase [Streptoalloteichus tenebrarius]MCP2262598.1 cyclase [Streptoalloteichus tenebrarius]BFF02993.1 MBL fold metallo-hydrolase [Streptoalloteichus tenebrarius]
MSQAATTIADTTPPAEMTEVADGVFAYVQPDGGWCLNNAGVLVTPGTTTVIDTAATETRARALRARIAELTPVVPRTVINTHSHGDHTFGNFVFTPDAEVVAHERNRAEVIENDLALRNLWPDVCWGEVVVHPATTTFADRLTLHRDDLRVELFHPGPAHTTNDVVVWVPERRVLFTGDIAMSGCAPFVLMGSVSGSLEVLERLRGLGAETVVCGHGPVGGPEVLDANLRYFEWLRRVAREAVAAGLSPLDAARELDMGEFAGLLDSERIVGNLHRAMAEERGLERGVPLDVVGIFQEIVAFHGGLPTCRA